MRWGEFFQFTPEERRAMLAILLFTGGGGLLLELARRYPRWAGDLVVAQSAARRAPAAEADSLPSTHEAGLIAATSGGEDRSPSSGDPAAAAPIQREGIA